MKMRKLFFVLVLALTSVMAKAQTDSIRGQVTDKDGVPVELANVMLLAKQDSAFIGGTVSDLQGQFVIASPACDHILKVSSVGYKTAFINSSSEEYLKLVLESEMVMLGNVTVKGHRPSFKLSTEGITTNVQNTSLALAGTADDVLSQIPLVIKTEDGYQVFGKGEPLIYLNGHKLYSLSELDNLKSQDIKNIEVITNPGAQYDASVTAVIKIRTVKPQGEGLSLDLRSVYTQGEKASAGEYVSLNYRVKGLDIFDYFSYNNTNKHNTNVNTQHVVADTIWHQNTSSSAKRNYEKYNNTFGLNYELAPDNYIGAKYILTLAPHDVTKSSVISDVLANDKKYDLIETNIRTVREAHPSHQFNVYYAGNIKDLSVSADVDYVFNKVDEFAHYDELSTNYEDRVVTTQNDVRNTLFSSKLVLSYPLFGGNIDLGGDYSKTKRNDIFWNEQDIVPSANSRLEEVRDGVSLEYNKEFSFGDLTAGLRYEKTKFDYYEDERKSDAQSRNYSSLFPSINLNSKLGKVMFRLSYTTKTQRPSYRQLSDNVLYANRFTWQSGNPLLKPQYIHNIGLDAIWKWVQVSVSYQDTRDAIIYWADQVTNNESITCINYKNLNSIKNLTTSLVLSPKFGIWSPVVSVAMDKQFLNLETKLGNYKMNKPLFLVGWNNNFRFSKDFSAYINWSYQSKGDYQNIYMDQSSSVINISATKTFLDNRLSLQVQFKDVFKGMKDGNMVYNDRMKLYTFNKYDSRNLVVTLRYKFNVTRSKYYNNSDINSELRRF